MESRGQITRRTALRQAGVLAAAVAALEAAGPLAFVPQRALAANSPEPDKTALARGSDPPEPPRWPAARFLRHRAAGRTGRGGGFPAGAATGWGKAP